MLLGVHFVDVLSTRPRAPRVSDFEFVGRNRQPFLNAYILHDPWFLPVPHVLRCSPLFVDVDGERLPPDSVSPRSGIDQSLGTRVQRPAPCRRVDKESTGQECLDRTPTIPRLRLEF